jgi:microfibrillar-associated protein 1
MAARARAAHGETRVTAQSRVGSGRHGGVSEKIVEAVDVRRYWPGKAPKWVADGGGEPAGDSGDEDAGFGEQRDSAPSRADAGGATVDRRLQRLADEGGTLDGRRRSGVAAVVEKVGSGVSDSNSDGESIRGRRRAPAVIVEPIDAAGDAARRAGGESDDEDDDDAIEARRERLLAMRRRRAQEAEEEARAAQAGGDESDEEGGGAAAAQQEEESEYETDDESEEEGGAPRVLMKPVFVSSSMRETIRERDARLEAEEAARAKRDQRIAERADESRQMLVQIIQQEEAAASEPAPVEQGDIPDDDDDADELDSFDLWKLRELRRVKKEREEARAAEAEKAELLRRRSLTDAERKAEDEEFARQRADFGSEKTKWSFLQRYYHKGAFFQEEDETGNAKLGPVMMQDFGAATGRDAIGNREAMPAPMQVKNFGMRSQVKWTHLAAEDTSSKDALWASDRRLSHQYRDRMAGYKAANDFERPGKRKKTL